MTAHPRHFTPAERRTIAANCYAFPRSMTPEIEAMAAKMMTALRRKEGKWGGVPAASTEASAISQKMAATQEKILVAIRDGAHTRANIAQLAGLADFTVTDHARRMDRAGLISREMRRSGGPLRAHLTITPAGRAWLSDRGVA